MKYIPSELPPPNSTVVVGMSGGVDSTLTALLLKEKGCHVIGVTMSIWDGHIPEIPAVKNEKKFHDACYGPEEKEDIEECFKFCTEHNIEYHVIDVSKEYNDIVLKYFKEEYRKGKTPNPCIRCNSFIKFGSLLEGIKKINIDFDYFCTGHYAMVVQPAKPVWKSKEKPYMIACPTDDSKDQSYFLYRLPSSILQKVRFPLASLKKSKVFELARNAKLKVAEKKESQDFIDSKYLDYLFSDKPSVCGDFTDTSGNVLGRHKGIEHYTIGQRRGLGISSKKPLYVKEINPHTNKIILAEKSDLESISFIADDFVWPGNIEPDKPFKALVKIRLRSKSIPAKIERYTPPPNDSHEYTGQPYKITCTKKQSAVTPGQSIVIYKNNVIQGGGIIQFPLEK